jgi:8-oxo-dGTP pyrophosphatase MutT (NUDIX family)
VHTFIVDVPADWEPTLNFEHDDYRWCSRDDAVELLHWPEPKAVLRGL